MTTSVLFALPFLAAAATIAYAALANDVMKLSKIISQCGDKFKPLKEADAKIYLKRVDLDFNCGFSEMLLRNKQMTVAAVLETTRALDGLSDSYKSWQAHMISLQEKNSPAATPDTSDPDVQNADTAETGKPSADECQQLRTVYDEESWPKPKVSGIKATMAEWRRDMKGLAIQAVADCYRQKVGSASPSEPVIDKFSQTMVRKAWGVKNGQTGSAENPSELEALEAMAFFNCALARMAKNKKMAGKKFSEMLEYGIMEWLYNFSTVDLAKDFAASKHPSDMEYPWMLPKTDVCLQNRAAIYGMKRFHMFIDMHIRNAKL